MPLWRRMLLKLTPAPAAYRPERYYMRGPGPKYRERHGQRSLDMAAPEHKPR